MCYFSTERFQVQRTTNKASKALFFFLSVILLLLRKASLPSMKPILLQVQLRWAVHVARMEDIHMPKALFFSELQQGGKRDRGAPRKRYKNQLKKQLAQAGINRRS